MEPVEALSQSARLLVLGGREFVILPPTPRDKLVTHERMKALAKAQCVSPLDYVATKHAHLPPAAFAIAVSEAIKIGAGAPVSPSVEAVWEQYATLAGVRWRVWYHISRALKDFDPKEVEALVTEDNLYDASDALDAALGLGAIDPNAQPPATGSAS